MPSRKLSKLRLHRRFLRFHGSTDILGPLYRDEFQIVTRFEQIFHDSFAADTRSTLAVVCFALGTWVGGMYTANCCRYLASKGYPITLVTPGNNKEEILRVVRELAPHFEQVVLLGYPPFLKDVVDTGIARGVEWHRVRIKWVMAGEVFSEEWRSLVGDRVGSSTPCYDSPSLYRTADAGVLGNETPLALYSSLPGTKSRSCSIDLSGISLADAGTVRSAQPLF